ncbi:hypothetical protein C8J57DRAFT_1328933, partial [Mycena rebaudengoi]
MSTLQLVGSRKTGSGRCLEGPAYAGDYVVALRGGGHLPGRVVVRALAARQPLYSPSCPRPLLSLFLFFFLSYLPTFSPSFILCQSLPLLVFVLHSSSRSIAPATHRSWSRPPAAARRPLPSFPRRFLHTWRHLYIFIPPRRTYGTLFFILLYRR